MPFDYRNLELTNLSDLLKSVVTDYLSDVSHSTTTAMTSLTPIEGNNFKFNEDLPEDIDLIDKVFNRGTVLHLVSMSSFVEDDYTVQPFASASVYWSAMQSKFVISSKSQRLLDSRSFPDTDNYYHIKEEITKKYRLPGRSPISFLEDLTARFLQSRAKVILIVPSQEKSEEEIFNILAGNFGERRFRKYYFFYSMDYFYKKVAEVATCLAEEPYQFNLDDPDLWKGIPMSPSLPCENIIKASNYMQVLRNVSAAYLKETEPLPQDTQEESSKINDDLFSVAW